MSAPNAEGPSGDGVRRSSALSYLAHTQDPGSQLGAAAGSLPLPPPPVPETLVPAGVRRLLEACSAVYPDQPNPLQVTTRIKYWLGGQDPLDYISMYWNRGDTALNVPPHWHYISFGLSDLHGDGRVHPCPQAKHGDVAKHGEAARHGEPARHADPARHGEAARNVETARHGEAASSADLPSHPSGKGIELTFRLAAETPHNAPLWPASLMQALARYIHATGNSIVPGDHVRGVSLGALPQRHLLAARDPQLAPLRTAHGNSIVPGDHVRGVSLGALPQRHLLAARDPQLAPLRTEHGSVTFTQLVACTGRELLAAQRGDPHAVIADLAAPDGCSPYLVSRPRRRSVTLRGQAGSGRAQGGGRGRRPPAALAAVTAPILVFTPKDMDVCMSASERDGASGECGPLSRTRGSLSHSIEATTRMSTDSFEMSSIERALPDLSDTQARGVLQLGGAHVLFSREAAAMLPLAIDERVLLGAHFTFSSAEFKVTLLGPGVTHALASRPPRHVALTDSWLQIYLPDDLAMDMSKKFANLYKLADTDSESETEDTPNPTNNKENTTSDSAPNQDGGAADKNSNIGVRHKRKRDNGISLPCSFSWPEYKLVFSIVEELYPTSFMML